MVMHFISHLLAILVPQTEEEAGQTITEYALLLALIAVVLVGAIQALTGAIGVVLGNVAANL